MSHSHHRPIVFDEFFQLGLEDSVSPFLTKKAKRWAFHLDLRAAIFSAICLTLSFALSFIPGYTPISMLLLVQVYFFAGVPSLIHSLEDIGQLEINIDVLMTLAAFSSILIGSPMEGGLLLVLFSLSEAMGEAVESKAKGSIQELYKLSPSVAQIIEEDGTLHERAVQDVTIGTKILVRAGEVVPLDGVVTDGASSVNLVHLTGESLPVTKEVGNSVPAGAQNLEGTLTVEVKRTSSDSTISQIINLVTKAQESRPNLQKWFDRLSRGYALSIITLAALFAASFPFLLGIPLFGFDGSVYRALAFLIAASPCALIIATPIAYLSAVSTCAKQGILLKGGITLDAIATCGAIAFDKTGTLTTGKLHCREMTSMQDGERKKALGAAVALERNAVHPIATAIVMYGKSEGVSALPIESFKSTPGYGVEAITKESNIPCYLGRPSFILEKINQKRADQIRPLVEKERNKGLLVALLLFGEDIFLFTFEDTIRSDMKETIDTLRKGKHQNISILTGDHKKSAERVAEKLDIDQVFADLNPADKLRYVGKLTDEFGLAMVGDGVNDAPALARASVGISLGKVGSQTAVEAADVVLLHDELNLLPWLFEKASQTKRVVRQNLVLAAGVILIATTPALLGWVPLWAAVVLHEGGTVIVGLNALRLLR